MFVFCFLFNLFLYYLFFLFLVKNKCALQKMLKIAKSIK